MSIEFRATPATSRARRQGWGGTSLLARIGTVAGILASAFLFAPAASASNAQAETFLLGTWAVACDRAVADGNPLAVFFRVPKTGALLMAVVSRNGDALTSSVTQVFTTNPAHNGRLEVDFDHAEGGVNRAILEVTPGSFQVLRTTRLGGEVTTRDRVVLATGKPTLLYRRCAPSH